MNNLRKYHEEFIKTNKTILKTQQRFTFLPKKTVLTRNDDKRIQSVNSVETYQYGTSNYLVCKKEKVKCNNIIKQYKNDDVTKESIKEHLLKIPGHPCRLLIIWGFRSRTTNSLFNRISHLPDIDKIYLYTKDSRETKYYSRINK